MIFIDDGSSDTSWEQICNLASDNPDTVLGLKFRRNFGKAVALSAGFDNVSGDVVFTMDGDLQDDPNEIPAFLEMLDGKYDLVSGWKRRRQDPASKKLPSMIFNYFTAKLSGIQLRDFNCGFKAYKREVVNDLNLYGELHRYIPILADDLGFRVGELPVKHHSRQYGTSKYGLERYMRGFLDLLSVLATTRYLKKPGHLFGGTGILFGVLGTSILVYLSFIWSFDLGTIGNRPLLFLGILLEIISVQLISLGLLAELLIAHFGGRPSDQLISERTVLKATV